ncbi:Tyrosine recombinase XerA [uncultured archaeon]|nr:Tyrosine recombinase XerA [uncultured archaeon]
MMSIDVENDARIEQWLNLIEASKATRKSYLTYIKAYCECVDKTPSELIDEAEKETKGGKLLSERNTVIYLAKFKKCLADKSPNTQGVALSTVQSFYKTFDIQLSAAVGKRKKRIPLRENQNFISKADVKTLITNAKNLRMKAIILCMATSGMAKNEILNLRMRDIIFDDNDIGTVSIRREKAQVDYVTFISPEAVAALKNYFNERNRDDKLKVKGTNDFVFVTYGEKLQEGEKKGSGKGSNISPQTFTNEFKKLGEDLGYGNGEGYMVKSRSHALRKFFASTLENAGVPKNKVDYMLGHTPSGNDLAYFQHDIDKLKELYIKYLPYITFEKTIEVRSLDTEDAKKLAKLEDENIYLKKEVGNLQEMVTMRNEDIGNTDKLYREEIDRLFSEVRELKRALSLNATSVAKKVPEV